VTSEGQKRSTMRCMKIRMELTEASVTEDITPFERERLREALEEKVRRLLPASGAGSSGFAADGCLWVCAPTCVVNLADRPRFG
jgi:hypothetical protein